MPPKAAQNGTDGERKKEPSWNRPRLVTHNRLTLAVLCGLLSYGAPLAKEANTTLAGQVFIATKGGQSVKLGGVVVSVYPKAEFRRIQEEIIPRLNRHRDATRRKLDNAKARGGVVAAVGDGLAALEYYYQEWLKVPKSAHRCTTDADGRFTLNHSITGPYIVVAAAKRQIGDVPEYFLWRINDVQVENPSRLLLTNANADTP